MICHTFLSLHKEEYLLTKCSWQWMSISSFVRYLQRPIAFCDFRFDAEYVGAKFGECHSKKLFTLQLNSTPTSSAETDPGPSTGYRLGFQHIRCATAQHEMARDLFQWVIKEGLSGDEFIIKIIYTDATCVYSSHKGIKFRLTGWSNTSCAREP